MAGWGYGTSQPSVAATEAVAPVAATSSGRYEFSASMRKVKIHLHPDAGGYLWIKWNADAAGKTLGLWNDIIVPGGSVEFPGEAGDALVHKLGVWMDANLVYGTDFSIEAWE